jgi:hypothetical protein
VEVWAVGVEVGWAGAVWEAGRGEAVGVGWVAAWVVGVEDSAGDCGGQQQQQQQQEAHHIRLS